MKSLEEFYAGKWLERLAQQGLLLFDQVREDPNLVEEPVAAQRDPCTDGSPLLQTSLLTNK